jgi:quercetin dioxygenase-like cupin family protein
MKTVKKLLFAALLISLSITAAVADEKVGQATAPSPIVVNMSKFPITIAGSDYDLLTIIQDFPAGAGVATHKHGGYVLATVLSGEITLRDKGIERVVKTGESWNEKPGDIHAVVNGGAVTTRVAVSILIPKGAEVTTMVK